LKQEGIGEDEGGDDMVWKDCGYLSLTKKGDKILIVLKHGHYIADLKEIKDVLYGKRDYTLIFEPPEKDAPQEKEKGA
jgi:hypothetical protein